MPMTPDELRAADIQGVKNPAPHMANEQWTALPMFMTANEIMAGHQASEWERMPKRGRGGVATGIESHGDVMERKLRESKTEDGGKLYNSIAAEGVQQPVHLAAQFGRQDSSGVRKGQIAEGNHRVASSLEAAPNRYIPVIHHGTVDDAGLYIMDYE